MQTFAISLLLISAVMHAGWNAFGKQRVPTMAFFLVASAGGGVLLSPVLVLFSSVLGSMAAQDVMLVVSAGLFEAIYLGSLAAAYRTGELSIAYPVARAMPAVFVAAVSVLMGHSPDAITVGYWPGAVLIVIGSLLVPLRSFSAFRLSAYTHPGFVFALVAALGTTGYAILDDAALERLRTANPDMGTSYVTLVYACLQAWLTACWLSLTVVLNRDRREALVSTVREGLVTPVLTGGWITVTYALVLLAMAYADDVSYVVAFRQISIPMGVGMGIFFLREPAGSAKLVGTLTLVVGVLFIALAGA
jgi:uncharacterized membrane protein